MRTRMSGSTMRIVIGVISTGLWSSEGILHQQGRVEKSSGRAEALISGSPRLEMAPATCSTGAMSRGKMAAALKAREPCARRVKDGDQPQSQRFAAIGAGGGRYAAALCAAQRSGVERGQIRLRTRSMRSLHSIARRPGGALVRHRDRLDRRRRDHHDRGPRHRRQAAPAVAGLHRRAGRPVRLLHQRHDHDGEGSARSEPASDGSRGARGAGAESVPVRHARPHHPRGAARGAKYRKDMIGVAVNLTRRHFGKAAGVLVLTFALAARLAGAQAPKLPGSLANNRMLDAWLRINADGSAMIFTGKVELGQGISTALMQIAAEELDLPLARVRMISGDTAQTPDEGYTSGSQSIEYGGTAIRLACAEARALLIDQAAKRFGLPAEGLKVSEGVVAAPDGRKLGYGELAAELDLDREVTATVAPKPPALHTIVGRSVLRRDIPPKVTGGAAYVQDIRLPGMAHGRVVRPPRYDARLDNLDEAPIRAMPGVVTVVRDG